MAQSYVTATGDGTVVPSITVGFSYILKSHVKVYKNRDILLNTGTEATDYEWNTAGTQITMTGAASTYNGVVITVERQTPNDTQLVPYVDGSNLIAESLNNADKQTLFCTQELEDRQALSAAKADAAKTASDTATTNVTTLTAAQVNKDGSVAFTGNIDAGNNKLTNLATPTAGTDGTTKTYVDNADALKANLSGATFTGNVIINVANNSDVSEGWFYVQDGSGNTKFSVNTGTGNTSIGGSASVVGNLTVTSLTGLAGDLAILGNTVIGNATTDTVTITAKLNSNLLPSSTSINLGLLTDRFGAIFGTTLDVTGNITVGGTVDGIDIGNAAIYWNAKQAALTFGIANTNTVKIDHASVASGEYAKFTSSGLEGKTTTELKTDLGLANVENTALSTWTGSSNISTIGANSVGSSQLADDAVGADQLDNNSVGLAAFSATGTLGNSVFLRGDNTWATPTASLFADDSIAIAKLVKGSPGQYLKMDGANVSWETVSPGSAGGANTIHMNDNVKITFGDTTTPDLEIFHEGPHSVIKHTDTSGYLELNTDNFRLMDDDGSLSIIKGFKGAGVELYFDNVKNFETTSNGAKVTGSLEVSAAASGGIDLPNVNTWITGGGHGVLQVDATKTYFYGGSAGIQFRNAANTAGIIDVADNGNASFAGDITVGGTKPTITLNDSNNESDYIIQNDDGVFAITDIDNSVGRLTIASNGQTTISGNCDFSNGIDVTGDATVTNGLLQIASGTCLIDLMETSTTNHRIKNGNGNFYIQRIDNNKENPDTQLAIDGGTGAVSIYHNGSTDPKLSTISTGAKVTGRLLIGTDTEGDSTADDLTIATTGTTGITIRSGSTSEGNIYFSKGTSGSDEYRAMLRYDHNVDKFYLKTNGSTALTVDDSQNTSFGGAVSVASKTVSQTATAVAALEIDCATGNYFTKAISASSTFTFANVPASGTAYGFVIEIDVTGSSTAITWPAAVKWPGGTAPTLTDTKTHVFTFATVDNGTTWRASSLVDYTT